MDDARHFFPFLPVAFALGIAVYFVWPSEPGFYYLVALPVLFAVGRVPNFRTPAGNYGAYAKSAMIFCLCLICGAGWAHLHSHRASQNWATPPLLAGGVETTISGRVDMSETRWRGGELHITVRASGLSNNAPEAAQRPFRARYPCAAHLVDRRVLKPFATTLVYVERTQSGLHIFTRIPQANAMRVWQRSGAQSP